MQMIMILIEENNSKFCITLKYTQNGRGYALFDRKSGSSRIYQECDRRLGLPEHPPMMQECMNCLYQVLTASGTRPGQKESASRQADDPVAAVHFCL